MRIPLLPFALNFTTICTSLVAILVLSIIYPFIRPRRRINVKNRHVLITGASTGLGFALAEAMVKRGANISILSKHPGRLAEAQKKLQASCIDSAQRVVAVQCDVTQAAEASRAVKEAIDQLGTPSYVFPAAGLALPGWFSEVSLEDHRAQMDLNYFGTLHIVKACMPSLIAAKQGNICFIASAMALMGFAGYSMYSPTKYALRGLADSLRNELLMYNINVRWLFVCLFVYAF